MSSDKEKILKDVLNYLKFYKDNYDYTVFKSEIKDTEPVFNLYDEENIKTEVNTESKDNYFVKENKELSDTKPKEAEMSTVKKSESNLSDNIAKEDNKWKKTGTLSEFEKYIKDCSKCALLSQKRTQIVFGSGNPDADIVVVGEAPGADEDIQGKPFVGRAGKLLTDILKAINLSREEIYICNILKCRPPENRNPHPDEIVNCEPYLYKQLEMIKPKMILALGTFASQTLLRSKEPLGKLRGRFHTYNGIKMMVTYHPAALLRNPNWKKPTWEDVQLFRKEFDSMS